MVDRRIKWLTQWPSVWSNILGKACSYELLRSEPLEPFRTSYCWPLARLRAERLSAQAQTMTPTAPLLPHRKNQQPTNWANLLGAGSNSRMGAGINAKRMCALDWIAAARRWSLLRLVLSCMHGPLACASSCRCLPGTLMGGTKRPTITLGMHTIKAFHAGHNSCVWRACVVGQPQSICPISALATIAPSQGRRDKLQEVAAVHTRLMSSTLV